MSPHVSTGPAPRMSRIALVLSLSAFVFAALLAVLLSQRLTRLAEADDGPDLSTSTDCAAAPQVAALDLTHVVGAWVAAPADGLLILDGARGATLIAPGQSLIDGRKGEWHVEGDQIVAFGRAFDLQRGMAPEQDRLVGVDGQPPMWTPIASPPLATRYRGILGGK